MFGTPLFPQPPPYPVFDFFDVESTSAYSTISSTPVSSPPGEFSWASQNFQPLYQPAQWNVNALPPHFSFSPPEAADSQESGTPFAQHDSETMSPFYVPTPFAIAAFHSLGLLEHSPTLDGQCNGDQAPMCALPYPLVPPNVLVHVHSGSEEEDERLAQAGAPRYIY